MKLIPDKKLHSREHLLADDLSRVLGEPKRFSAYLGIAKRYHESDLRGLLRYVTEKENLPREAYGKYFFAALRGFIKKYSPKQKTKKRKTQKKKGGQKARPRIITKKHRVAQKTSPPPNGPHIA